LFWGLKIWFCVHNLLSWGIKIISCGHNF
jgi:hypothetical protein